jgi:hypothetical protein
MSKLFPHQTLARRAITDYLRTGKVIDPDNNLPPEFFARRAGTFVSLHNPDDSLRGCIGTFLPVRKNLAEEIIHNAITAATEDPRFLPVAVSEVEALKISVDVLAPPQKTSREKLNPQKYGVIVSVNDGRRGLLLPDLLGVETAEQQLKIACQKAGIDFYEENFVVERFEAERYGAR